VKSESDSTSSFCIQMFKCSYFTLALFLIPPRPSGTPPWQGEKRSCFRNYILPSRGDVAQRQRGFLSPKRSIINQWSTPMDGYARNDPSVNRLLRYARNDPAVYRSPGDEWNKL